MSIVPTTFSDDDIFTLDVSYSFHRDLDSTNIGNVNVALEEIPSIQSHFDNDFSSVCTQYEYCPEDCVWPGDANADGIAKEDDLLYLGIGIGANEEGIPRTPPSPIWGAHNSENWDADFFDGINLKHADFNGDGSIDSLDDDILRLNFYQKTPGYIMGEKIGAPLAENELYVSTYRDAVFTWDYPLKRYSNTCVSMASEETPFQPLSGISFIIEYDTSLLEDPAWMSINLLSPTAFGDSSETMVAYRNFSEKGQVAFGVSRKDGAAVDSLHGTLVCIGVRLREDANITSPDSIEKVTFKIYDAYGATADGEIIQLGYMSDTLLASNLDSVPTFVSEFFSKKIDLEITPNPNHGTFTIFSENMDGLLALSIFNLNGKKIWEGNMPAGQNAFKINIGEKIKSGMYILKAVGKGGIYMPRKIIVK